MRSAKPYLPFLLAFLLFALLAAVFEFAPFPWPGWQLAACYPGCFCELFRPDGVVEPLSAFSNLFYVAAGLLILAGIPAGTRLLPKGVAGGANLLTRVSAIAAGFGIAAVMIGITSFLYHVSLTQVGRWLDYLGMYAFTGFALLYGLTRLFHWRARTFALGFVLLLAALGALWVEAPALRRTLLGGEILAIVIVELAVHWIRHPFPIRSRWLAAALACFLAALAVNLADESGTLCHPASLWQWHAVWHLVTAAATVFLFWYYRSEREGIL